jgi:hypothetical protein
MKILFRTIDNLVADLKSNNPRVTSANVQLRDIGDTQAVAEALESNRTLTALSMVYAAISIGDAGAEAIAKALKVNSSLTDLYLMHNAIGDPGAKAIAKALESNCTLTKMNLCHNAIGDAGAEALAKALDVNRTLKVLHLRGNSNIGTVGAEAIAIAIRKNPRALVAFTPRQIVTMLYIHRSRHDRIAAPASIDKLPYEVIRCILGFRVNEKQRTWDERDMMMDFF